MAGERKVKAKIMEASFGVPWIIFDDIPLEWFDFPDTLGKMADAEADAWDHYGHRRSIIDDLKP